MKNRNVSRRKVIRNLSLASAALAASPLLAACGTTTQSQKAKLSTSESELFFSISLAQWSLNRSIFGKGREISWAEFWNRLQSDPDTLLQGEIDPLDFPVIARQKFGLDAIEYVNTFYFSKGEDQKYLAELKNRCDQEGVKSLLIMCDAEGNLGDTDEGTRLQSVKNHYKWIEAANFLGCHSIRVNAAGQGTMDEVKAAAVDGLGRLSEYGAANGINVIVENHGGYSSNGAWLSEVISQVGSDYCGTLPDFGNFCLVSGSDGCVETYDRYLGVEQLLPYAKGVSAKTYDFDADGNETTIDYSRILQLVKAAGFAGYMGIEYEGEHLSEMEGIQSTIDLLKREGAKI